MKYKPIIIGLAGTKGSGKDTIASMCDYILRNGFACANYEEWFTKYKDLGGGTRIIHFADRLKELCSEITCVPIKYFNESLYKDTLYFCSTLSDFIDESRMINNKYKEITIEDMIQYGIPDARIRCNKEGKISVFKLRTIMQYVGTNIFRNLIHTTFWIDNTIRKAKACSDNGHCIIADVRFSNESQAIRNINDRPAAVIKVARYEETNDSHESEQIDFTYDYEIDNRGSYMSTFYKVMNLLKQIYENN